VRERAGNNDVRDASDEGYEIRRGGFRRRGEIDEAKQDDRREDR